MGKRQALEREALDRREAFVTTLNEARERLRPNNLKDEAVAKAQAYTDRVLSTGNRSNLFEVLIVGCVIAAVAYSMINGRADRTDVLSTRRVPGRRPFNPASEETDHGFEERSAFGSDEERRPRSQQAAD
ncbi:MAG: hypothetical protein U1E46_15055 [Hyphomicrobiales bacterium]